MKQPDLRFHVIRATSEIVTDSYEPDGEHCPKCKMPTVKGSDITRRYCSNISCNALILEG